MAPVDMIQQTSPVEIAPSFIDADAPLLKISDIRVGNPIQLSWAVQTATAEAQGISKLATVVQNPLFPESRGSYQREYAFERSMITFFASVSGDDTLLLVTADCCDITDRVAIRSVYALTPYQP